MLYSRGMKYSKLIFTFCFLFVSASVHAAETYSVQELLEGYLANDLSIKQLTASAQKQQLNADLTRLDKGIDVSLSTGTVTIKTVNGGTSVSFKPSAELTVPQASNLTVSAGSSFSFDDTSSSVSNTSIAFQVDIISSSSAERTVSLLKAERQEKEAERKLANGFLSAEKQFYSELKALYNAASSYVSAQKSLYEDKISFDQIVVQGYAESSSKYRTAYMKYITSRHSAETAERELLRKVVVFASKCGIEYTETDAMQFLPSLIPEVEPVDVLSFDKEKYTELESALWTQYINQLSRDGDSSVTLTAGAGFTFNNAQTRSDSIDASARFAWDKILSVNGGVTIPVGTENEGPVVSLSLTVNPFGIKKASIENQITQLNVQQELYDIESAERNYETAVVSSQTQLSDILWSMQTNEESYQLYKSLAQDNEKWFSQGIISESELKSALTNCETYRLKCLISQIELIIYNNETQLMFCRDGE